MLLLVDAGNTRVKWALMEVSRLGKAEPGHWAAYGTIAKQDACGIADSLKDYSIERLLVSNVAGQAMHDELERMALRAMGLKPVPIIWFKSEAELVGIRNCYREPAQLGSDRFASMIGAYAMFPDKPLLVVTCGTATTIDAVTADGRFIGGMILPGLGLMASSLARNTAQLPQVPEYSIERRPFGDNTNDAIVTGCIAAQAGAIERAFAAHAADQGPPQCILSGGAAAIIEPHLSIRCRRVDNLVLIGLQAVAAAQMERLH